MIKKLIFLFFLLIPGVLGVSVSPSKLLLEDVVVGEESIHYFFLISPNEVKTYNIGTTCKEISIDRQVEVFGRQKIEFKVQLEEEPSFELDCKILIEQQVKDKEISVSNAAQISVKIDTTADKKPNVLLYFVRALSSEEGFEPVVFVGLENNGNVVLEPKLEFEALDNVSSYSFGKILVGERIQKAYNLPALDEGIYLINLSVKEKDRVLSRKTFSLNVLSSSSVNGKVLVESVNVTPGKLTRFNVLVRNGSPVPVESRAKVEIYKKNELVSVE
jgi:hypothetical protein